MRAGLSWALKGWKTYDQSLVVRLVIFAVALVVVGMVGRVLILLPHVRAGLAEMSSSHQLTLAHYVAGDIGGKVKARLDLLEHLASTLPPRMLDDPVRLDGWLKERHQINPIFSNGLMLVRRDGRGALAEYPVVAGRDGLDYSGSDWLLDAIRDGRATIGKPLFGRASRAPIIIMAAPVLGEDGRAVAVLAGVTALDAPGFLDLLQNTRIGENGGFLLISPKDGVFVAASDTSKILTPLPPPGVNSLHDRAMAGYRGTGVTTNLAGIEELSAMASVPGTDWFLVARLPTSEAFSLVDRIRVFVMRNSALLGLLAIAICLIVLPRFLGPLSTVSRMIHRMAEGEIPLQPVPVIRRDEVGELATGFNYLLARLNEVTAQKEAEERLRMAEKERLEVSLRQWMADTSHELRTPISVMRAQIEAIQDGVHRVDAHALDVLHRETMGMSRLVEDLNTLALSDVGRLDCRFSPMDPIALLEDVVGVFGSRYAAAGLAVTWRQPPEGQPIISGDGERLRQVFANLLENTLRYTDRGGGLFISGEVVAGSLVMHFDDTAPCVPDEALPRLFERFYRVEASRSRVRGGAGIGMALCRSIVEAHGGTIAASPSPMAGLRVTLILPIMAEIA
jgi:signal transduction histidine kinase